MIPATKAEYRRILATLPATPAAVLEVGALPGESSLLACPELDGARSKAAINLIGGGQAGDAPIVGMDARRMAFPDASFDLVLSASTLEHIPDFWLACAEMKRVLRPGGTLIVSTPGFGESGRGNRLRALAFRLGLPDILKRATVTMRVHAAPHDYYRFSEFAYRDVILAGLEDVRVWSIMTPPRLYGLARKPAP